MKTERFEYVTYIAARPAAVWKALVEPRRTVRYWQHVNVSDWLPGSRWEHRAADGKGDPELVGEVVESEPPRRLVLSWALPEDEQRPERHSRVVFEIDAVAGVTRLAVTHDRLAAGSDMLREITAGWPIVLSSLKTLLETGKALPELWSHEAA